MEQIKHELKTLRSILSHDLNQNASKLHLQPFLGHLAKHTFRPLPNQFTTLSITAALARWQDLKPVAADQLAKAIVGRWKVFDSQSKEDLVENSTPVFKSSEADAPEDRTEVDDLTQTVKQDTGRISQAPRLTYNPKPDWFDSILDFMTILMKPILALFK